MGFPAHKLVIAYNGWNPLLIYERNILMGKNIKTNLIFNLLYQIMATLFPLITAPYVSRVLGPEGIGTYSYSASIALYFIYFGMLGVANYGNRSVAQVRDNKELLNKTFSGIFYMQLSTASLVIVVYVIYTIFFSKYPLIFALQIPYVLMAAFDIGWLFFGLEEFKITATRQMILKVLNFVAILLFVRDANDVAAYTLIMSIGSFLNYFVLWFFVKTRVKFVSVPFIDWKKHFKPSIVLFFPIIALSVFGILDKVMIGTFVSIKETGYYESADKIVLMSSAVFSAFNSVLMPRISNLLGTDRKIEAMRYFKLSLEIVMCVAFALAFGFISVAQEFIPIFYGSGYEKSIQLLIGLSVGIPFVAWAQVFRVLYLIPAQKDNIYLKSTFIGAGINVLCNLILIFQYGALGVVVATVVSQIVIAVYQSYKVRTEIISTQYLKEMVQFSLLGMVMLLSVRAIANIIPKSLVSLVCEVFVGGIVYCIGAVIIFSMNKNELILDIFKKYKIGRN